MKSDWFSWNPFDWPAFLERVDLRRYPLPMTLAYGPHRTLCLSFLVEDHTTGKPRWLHAVPLQLPDYTTDEQAARIVRYWAQVTVLHELDECIYVDGRRPFNPHERVPLPQWGT
jgi:hypothetical protein